VLTDWGTSAERVQELLAEGTVARPE